MNAAQENNKRQRVEDGERNNNNGASEGSGKPTLNITYVHYGFIYQPVCNTEVLVGVTLFQYKRE